MLQYITLVLDDYEKTLEREHPGITLTRDFLYPPVLPIVFYDGKGKWTAVQDFSKRTAMGDIFEPYIPRFKYLLVDLNRYKPEDILRFGDVLSVVMFIDRINNKEDIGKMHKLLIDYLKQLKIPGNMVELIRNVSTVLLTRLGTAKEKIDVITDQIGKKGKQRMFDAYVESVLEDRRLVREEGRDEGRNEGRREEALEIARQMKEDGFTPEQIRKYTGVIDPAGNESN
jgi:hypothetical protein